MTNSDKITFTIPTYHLVEALKPLIAEVLATELKTLLREMNGGGEDELWTRKQTAKALLVSLPSLDRMWKSPNPKLKAYRIGGNKIRFKKSEVLNTLTSVSKAT